MPLRTVVSAPFAPSQVPRPIPGCDIVSIRVGPPPSALKVSRAGITVGCSRHNPLPAHAAAVSGSVWRRSPPGCRRGPIDTLEPDRSCTLPAASCRRNLTSAIPQDGRTGMTPHCAAPPLPREDSPTTPRPLLWRTVTRTSARTRSRGDQGMCPRLRAGVGGVCTQPYCTPRNSNLRPPRPPDASSSE